MAILYMHAEENYNSKYFGRSSTVIISTRVESFILYYAYKTVWIYFHVDCF